MAQSYSYKLYVQFIANGKVRLGPPQVQDPFGDRQYSTLRAAFSWLGSAHPRCARSIAGATMPRNACCERPGFPGPSMMRVGKTSAVACVKELGGRCDIEEDVRVAHGTRPSSARLMTT